MMNEGGRREREDHCDWQRTEQLKPNKYIKVTFNSMVPNLVILAHTVTNRNAKNIFTISFIKKIPD